MRAAASVLAAHPVPQVQLDALPRELRRALAAEAGQHGVQRLLLGDAGVEGLLPAEPGGDLQRLALVVAEAVEDADEEVAVGDRLADLQRRVPGGEHRQVVLVEVGDGLGVVQLELAVRDLIHPGAHDLAHELTAGLAPDRLSDDTYGVLGFDEAERHRGSWRSFGTDELPRSVGARSDGKIERQWSFLIGTSHRCRVGLAAAAHPTPAPLKGARD